MRKTIGFTTVLLILAVALGLYLYLYDSRKPTMRERNREWEPKPLVDREARIIGFEITREDDRLSIKLEPGTNAWVMEEPINTYAESILMNFMVREFFELEKERLVELEPEDLSKYGLDNPIARVTVNFAERPDLKLLVGKENYTQEHLFAKLENEPTVFLIPVSLGQYLKLDPMEFRSRSVFFHRPNQVLSLQIEVGDQQLKNEIPQIFEPKIIVQKKEGSEQPTWMIVEPLQEKAQFTVVERLFMWLNSTGASEVIDIEEEDLPKYGLDEPRAKIIIMCLDGIREEVHFGASDPENGGVFIRNSSRLEVMRISEAIMLEILTVHFRQDSVIIDMARKNPTKALFEYPKAPEKSFVVSPYEHSMYAPAGELINDEVVGMRVRAVIGPFQSNEILYLHHQSPFPDLSPYGLDEPQLNIKIWEDEELFLDVSLGNTVEFDGAMKTYMIDHNRGFVGAIDSDLYIEIPREKGDFVPGPEQLERLRKRWKRMENEKR